jgi:hypothetical protein
MTSSHVSLRYRHDAASAASRQGLYQADIVLQTNSGNLLTAAFDAARARSGKASPRTTTRWVETGFPSGQTPSVCPEIMLKQSDEVMIRLGCGLISA